MNLNEFIEFTASKLLMLAMLTVVVWALRRIAWAALWAWLTTVKPVVIDGLLYALIALFGALVGIFSSDEVYKYVNPHVVFWTRTVSSVLLATASALKMFRSTSYGDHRAEADKTENKP